MFHGGLIDAVEYVDNEARSTLLWLLQTHHSYEWNPRVGASDVNRKKARDFFEAYQKSNGAIGWSITDLHAATRCGFIYPSEFEAITGKSYDSVSG